jgi:hypothetical protein
MNVTRNLIAAILLGAACVGACGADIKTGRNADPKRWPNAENTPSSDRQGTGDLNAPRSSCFDALPNSIPTEFKQFCDNVLKPQAELKELYPRLCDEGFLVGRLKSPSCGWNGDPARMRAFMHHYAMQKDTTKDYEDVNASITHAPVPLERYMHPVRLAFENYDQFKTEGYQWVAGTREHRNLSATTWEQGIQYRFRADKVEYEIGYQGHMRLYQLTPDLFVHVNYATGDFARIAQFAQVMLYSRQSDQSTLAIKIEHRRVTSQGLYDLAKRSAADMAKDVMEKGYKNAIKP